MLTRPGTSASIFFFTVAVLAFGAFVWPSRYRYDRIPVNSDGPSFPLRIDRITGQADRLDPAYGWITIGESKKETEEPVPTETLLGQLIKKRYPGKGYEELSDWAVGRAWKEEFPEIDYDRVIANRQHFQTGFALDAADSGDDVPPRLLPSPLTANELAEQVQKIAREDRAWKSLYVELTPDCIIAFGAASQRTHPQGGIWIYVLHGCGEGTGTAPGAAPAPNSQ